MDWSSDAVLDFGPRNHCRFQRGTRKLLLWPAWAWRVVAPELRERALNPLQRVVLRLHGAGCRRDTQAAAFLGLDPELVAFVRQELVSMQLIDKEDKLSERGLNLLEQNDVDVGELRVGWVFHNGLTGRLFPRFVTTRNLAAVTADTNDHPRIERHSKSLRAFVLRHESLQLKQPTPREVVDAAFRHRLHVKRHQRAFGLDVGIEAPHALEHVSVLSQNPEKVHLLTMVYVPESEIEEHPWYVAEPFGFDASEDLREQLQGCRDEATGGLREVLDRLIGASLVELREKRSKMQAFLREQARKHMESALTSHADITTKDVRAALVEVYVELGRVEHEGSPETSPRSTDLFYLRLRQAIEAVLKHLYTCHPPGTAWHKVQELPRDASREIIRQCAKKTGFSIEIPRPVVNAAPGQVQSACTRGPNAIRPTLAAMLLAASDDPKHPLRFVAAHQPTWIHEINRLASVAGALVHAAHNKPPTIATAHNDAGACIEIIKTTLEALSSPAGSVSNG